MNLFNYPYIVELLSPKRSGESQAIEQHLDRFADRYQRIMDAGLGLSIPDNPMGQPRMGALESIARKGLQIDPNRTVVTLNTFHTKSELDEILEGAAAARLEFILVVRGDGGPLLPKLEPQSIGVTRSVVTSVDLIRYINVEFPGRFVTGAAYNPYRTKASELRHMARKIEAGAKFAITQPVIGRDQSVDQLALLNIPIVIEAWMSKNIDLLYKSVGKDKDKRAEDYDPVENLKALHTLYPECCVYLSMLSFKQDWRPVLPKLIT
jgi:5,10-methylenetetrahydrofolate reductase